MLLEYVFVLVSVVEQQEPQAPYYPSESDSLFCFTANNYYNSSTAIPECQSAPQQCIPLFTGLDYGDDNFDSNCFNKANIDNGKFLTSSTPLQLAKVDKNRIPATYLFNGTNPMFFEEQYPSNPLVDKIACISSAHILTALLTLDQPNITFQMAAYSHPLFESSDADVIKGIDMYIYNNSNLVSANNSTPAGLFTLPSGLVFQIEGKPNVWYSIEGSLAKLSDTDKKVNPFKAGAFKGTAVLNTSVHRLKGCTTIVENVPITKVFRKLGIAPEKANIKIPANVWFDTSDCQTNLRQCEDISQLQKPCTDCTRSNETVHTPCGLFQNTICVPRRTASPTDMPKTFSAKEEPSDVPILYIFLLAVVGGIILILVTLVLLKRHRSRKPRELTSRKTLPPKPRPSHSTPAPAPAPPRRHPPNWRPPRQPRL